MAMPTTFCRLLGPAPATLGLGPTHSGMTPLGPRPLQHSAEEEASRKRIEEYQRGRLKGFTMQMLFDLDALTSRALRPSDINTALDPLLRRSRWVQLPPVYIHTRPPNYVPAMSDLWSVQMDSVWNALHPVLCLASVILKHVYRHPWFDTLIMGRREPVSKERFDAATLLAAASEPEKYKFESIKLRPPGAKGDCEAHRLVLFTRHMDQFVELDFMDGFVNPHSGKSVGRYACGMTSRNKADITIYLAKQELYPLLRTDLSSSQRLAEQLGVAQTLLHEVMHAYFMVTEVYTADIESLARRAFKEPFFEDEQAAELGYSAENSLFGGITEQFILSLGRPSLGHFHESWPDRACKSGCAQLVNPASPRWRVMNPLPVSYYEMLQCDDFWKVHFRSYGSIRSERSPVVSVLDTTAGPDAPWIVQTTGDYWPPATKEVEDRIRMTPDERRNYESKMKSAKRNAVAKLLRERDGEVPAVVAQSEVCTSLRGNEADGNKSKENSREKVRDRARYIAELEKLYELLVVLVEKTTACIPALQELEERGDKRNDLRNNILVFEHNLRRLVRTFENCGRAELDERLSGLLFTLEASSVGLVLQPSRIDVYGHPGPLREEQQLNRQLEGAAGKLAKGDAEGCRGDCARMMANPGASLQLRCRARLLYARLEGIPIEARRAELERARETIRRLVEGGGEGARAVLRDAEADCAAVQRMMEEM